MVRRSEIVAHGDRIHRSNNKNENGAAAAFLASVSDQLRVRVWGQDQG